MAIFSTIPEFDEVAGLIAERYGTLRPLLSQWADLARLAVQGLPYDRERLEQLQARINGLRADLRIFVLVASEHFTSAQLDQLRKQVAMSKSAWRSLKTKRPVTMRSGFKLVIY